MQLQREGELVPALPRVFRQQRRAGDEIGERRGVGGRGLGALAREQVELGQLLTLVSRGDQRGAAVELIDDLEDGLFASFRRGMRREQPADAQVRLGAQSFRYERIGGLLDTVVDELVRALQVLDQLQTNGAPRDPNGPPRSISRERSKAS